MADDFISGGFEDQRRQAEIARPSQIRQPRLPDTVLDPAYDYGVPADPSNLQQVQEGNMSFTGSDFEVQIHFPSQILSRTPTTQGGGGRKLPLTQQPIFPDNQPRVYNLVGLTSLSVNTFREQIAVRPLGYTKPAGYGPGPRTVAGTLVITILQKSPLKKITVFDPLNRSIGEFNLVSDSLPPFNLIVTGMNEYGEASMMIVHGVKITTTGQTISVYDRLTEEAYEFVAEDLTPLTSMHEIKGLVDEERVRFAKIVENQFGFENSYFDNPDSHGNIMDLDIADILDRVATKSRDVEITQQRPGNTNLVRNALPSFPE